MLYGLANTIFSINIVSFYFPVWVERHMGGTDAHVGIAFSASMVLVALASPVVGAFSDQIGRRVPYLAMFTVASVLATLFLGVGTLELALVLFIVANIGFQLAGVFYDALLPEVSTESTVGTIGGLGVSAGYLGAYFGMGVGALLLHFLANPHPWIFAATGAMFLLFAMPSFFLVERGQAAAGTRPRRELRKAWNTAKDTIKTLKHERPLTRFLIARFVYTDAVNTVILFMGIYATSEVGFPEAWAQLVLGVGIAGALVGGYSLGRVVDRVNAKRVLLWVMVGWMLVMAAAAAIPLLELDRNLFWVVAVFAGVSLGGTWAADRPLMLELIPTGRVGEFYGVYGMVGRFAAVTGPLTWAIIVDFLGWGRPVAVITLLLGIVVATWILWGVDTVGSTARHHARPIVEDARG